VLLFPYLITYRWATDQLTHHYLSKISKPCILALSGFFHNERNYFLPRASQKPPTALLEMVFPEIEKYLYLLESNVCSLATKGFIKLLLWGRIVFPFFDLII
jgi:hypothetical protein